MNAIAMVIAVRIRLTSTRFMSWPWIIRITRSVTKIAIMLQPMALRMAAERVLSSSSGKIGGARSFRNAFCILFLATGLLLIRIAKDLDGNFGIVQPRADFRDCGAQYLLIFRGGTDGGGYL